MIRHYAGDPTDGGQYRSRRRRAPAFDHSFPVRARFTRSDAQGEHGHERDFSCP